MRVNASAFSNTAQTISGGQLTRPFPAFGDIYELVNNGRSGYNSVQTTVNHRWNSSLILRVGWTWQKTMESGFWADRRYNIRHRGIDQLDMTQKSSVLGTCNRLGRR